MEAGPGNILSGGFLLLRRYGLGLYADFLAAGILLTTVASLIDPDMLRAEISGNIPPGTILGLLLFNPWTYVSSVLFAVVSAVAVLRIWWAEEGAPSDEGAARTLFRDNIVPLLLIQIAADIAFTLALYAMILPSILVAALTTFLIPAIMIEDRGWGGLTRAVELALPRVLPLCVVWTAIIIPLVVTYVMINPNDPAWAERSDLEIWTAEIIADIYAPLFSAYAMCVIIAAYKAFSDPTGRDLEDLFR